MKDYKRFSRALTLLAELFDKELSAGLHEIYWSALTESLTDQEFEDACSRLARSNKFWPKPAEFLEAAKGGPEAQAWAAWEQLLFAVRFAGQYRSVKFLDSKISRMIKLMGGWVKVCEMTGVELPFRRQEFLKGYQALDGEAGEPEVLAGVAELDNTARGYLEFIPKPVEIGARDGQPALEYQEAGK